MLGAPFKPYFGLSGITALDLPSPICPSHQTKMIPQTDPGFPVPPGVRDPVLLRRTFHGRWQIASHYPTQAKGRLEWATQHSLPMWQKNLALVQRSEIAVRAEAFQPTGILLSNPAPARPN